MQSWLEIHGDEYKEVEILLEALNLSTVIDVTKDFCQKMCFTANGIWRQQQECYIWLFHFAAEEESTTSEGPTTTTAAPVVTSTETPTTATGELLCNLW